MIGRNNILFVVIALGCLLGLGYGCKGSEIYIRTHVRKYHPSLDKTTLLYPANLRYTKEHMWVSAKGKYVCVGLTDYGQYSLGDIAYVDIHSRSKQIDKDSVFAIVEAVAKVSDLLMPVKGLVVRENKRILSKPELVKKDAYHRGWFIKVIPTNISDLTGLMDASSYKKYCDSISEINIHHQ